MVLQDLGDAVKQCFPGWEVVFELADEVQVIAILQTLVAMILPQVLNSNVSMNLKSAYSIHNWYASRYA